MSNDEITKAVTELRLTRLEIVGRFSKCLKGHDIACRKECNHCCQYPILISIFEASVILDRLKVRGLWTQALRQQLKDHHSSIGDLDLSIWTLSGVPCPLLSDGLCMAYESRPMACRLIASKSVPGLCAVSNLASARPHIPNMFFRKDFDALELRLSKQVGIPLVRLPISEMVLRAEMLATGKVALENIFTDKYDL